MPRDCAPHPAVVRRTAVVAEHEVFARGHHAWRSRNMIAIRLGHIRLIEQRLIHRYLPVSHLYLVAGHTDHPFDEGLRRIAGEPEHYRIAPVDVGDAEAVGELVDENAFLIDQRRHHTGAFHAHRLVEKQNHHYGDQYTHSHVSQP